MTTQLTSPIAKNETQATLDFWSLSVARDGSLNVVVPNTMFGATLSVRYADGTVSRQVQLSQDGTQLSPAALNAIRTLHAAVITYLRAQGLLPPGNDTADF